MINKLVTASLVAIIISVVFYCNYETPIAQKERIFTFKGWRNSYNLTPDIIESDAHNAYIEIYLNEKAKMPYIDILPKFPVGSELYKPLYSDIEGKEFARLVIMVKMYKGYDSKNGDWWYGVSDESGEELYYEGKIPECINCHMLARETDYLFARSVMKKLQGIDTNEFEEYLPDDEDY